MKYQTRNDINKNLLTSLDELNLNYIDKEKLYLFNKDVLLGIKNYFLFQNYFYFKWPYWLYNTFSVKSRTFNPVIPFQLLNNNNRNWITFSSRHSSKRFYIDPAGMISPFIDRWSIEFWVLEKNIFHRPQEKYSSIIQKDIDTFLINIGWKEVNFELIETIYGILFNTEEVIVELNNILRKDNIPHSLFIVIRPYNPFSLGGLESIEYNKTRTIRINGYDRIYLDTKPDYIIAGNASIGDIDSARNNKKTTGIKCDFGMATLAFGYNLSKGNNEYKIRISLSNGENINPVKLNYSKLKNEYIEYTSSRSKNGFKLTSPDKIFQKWIYGAKISALNFMDDDVLKAIDSYNADFKSIFYITSGYNRMGFSQESLKILNSAAGKIKGKEKLTFSNILDRCYFIIAVSDYFQHSRDIDYIKSRYKSLCEIIAPLIRYSGSIKEKKIKIQKNSIESYYILEHHVYDILLISFSLFEFSYLARCLGIFNDENKFNKESLRLEELISEKIHYFIDKGPDGPEDREEENEIDEKQAAGVSNFRNEYYSYLVFAGFPFNVKSLPLENLKTITDRISNSFTENPIYFKSIGGCDTFFSIIYAINLLLVKDPRAHSIINKLFEFGKEKYILPDIINPKTGCGIRGEGDSITVISAFFTLLRSVIFMDSQEKLEIFPAPKEEWFIEGSEIKIEDAPSIFGALNFRVISTKDEVQFYFYELPKYIPPTIIINLPFPARIKKEDDFIIKKEIRNSYSIHGWPAIIRFLKR